MYYYVNDHAQASGDHEVHRSDCYYVQFIESKTFLGSFLSCGPAVAVAKTIYPTADGCAYCSPACNHG